ncbi:MAG: glutamate dehydrogenase [Okeania sp. SIO2C2]|uniref:Glu/Leu/Phe/Val dehydrogenase dimerization domain-containing protein n=1 Tax=Okeania sp. SIO2C2 TaxID=2607787 RepID=UPI0013BA4A32|nr:Glu/Leu/Phe/Val dehydrogenase dimerization domain-containing protein [Okeania sp. SIO2C2]NEP90828.1 glutamate dehydrogenase [Okeania sp. SIO2C2]
MKIIQKDRDGLQCFIGLDRPTLSHPSNGGLRVKTYKSQTLAWEDCRNLSLVMTNKHRLYNTGFSGGKIVVAMADCQACKKELLSFIGSMLNELNGLMYTGCDLNTSLEDMEYLRNHCPYILASLDSQVDPSIATAYGVVGSIQGIFGKNLEGLVFLVHGSGKVGKATALGLQKLGASIMTYDIVPQRADLPNCKNISQDHNWWDIPCNALVPCSISGLITPEIADSLQCQYIVGSANVPLSEPSVLDILQAKSITFIPESISSAGAVICDSIEFYAPSIFKQVDPCYIYAFVQEIVEKKVKIFVTELTNSEESYEQVISTLISAADKQPRVGCQMPDFLEKN